MASYEGLKGTEGQKRITANNINAAKRSAKQGELRRSQKSVNYAPF